MLLFYCTHCNEMIAADDSETLPGGELAVYDHSLRIRYGHTDHHARSSIAETGAWTLPHTH
jgi:hypothetical protein